MIKELWQDGKEFMKQKAYVIAVSITAVLSYGYLWMHPAINVDDTAMVRYFYDGLAPQVGRWTLFVINKIFKIAQFNPLVTDFLGVVFMAAGATVFCILVKKLVGDRLHPASYPLFTCLMISYPLICEVYTYYLHNGIGLAYFLTMWALYITVTGRGWKPLAAAGVLLAAAISCYESFAAVYLLGIFLVWMVRLRLTEQSDSFREYAAAVLRQVIPIVIGMILRTVICRLLLLILGLEPVMRSVGASIGWIFSGQAGATLATMVKTFARYYVLNAVANPAILIFLVAMVLLVVYTVRFTVATGKKLILLTGLAILVIPWLISFMEGSVAIYRSMQVLPVLTAFCLTMLFNELFQARHAGWRVVGGLLAAVVLYNQVFEMNHWFYVDYLCYEEDVRRCESIALDIEKEATLDKPVVFVGKMKEPGTVTAYAYVSQDSWAYRVLSAVDRRFGSEPEEGEEKQYAIVQNMVWYPMFDWAVDAFDEPGTELIAFFRMNGYPLLTPDQAMKEEALTYAAGMSVWPKDGSILETEEYVIVKLGESEG